MKLDIYISVHTRFMREKKLLVRIEALFGTRVIEREKYIT